MELLKDYLVSIHAPREGCDKTEHTDSIVLGVSIHAPREGCDLRHLWLERRGNCFNSRTPGGVRLGSVCYLTAIPSFNSRTPGGVRHILVANANLDRLFQFTHPGRGATLTLIRCNYAIACFNSRTPGGVRPQSANSAVNAYLQFQFTHPGRGATAWARFSVPKSSVSIHAPREGCDEQEQ